MNRLATNTLKVDGELIFITLVGFQDKDAIVQLRVDFKALVERQRASGRPALIVTDISKIADHDSGALVEAKEFIHDDFDAIAVFGASVTNRVITNWLIKRAGQEERVRIFDDRRSALAWIKKMGKQ